VSPEEETAVRAAREFGYAGLFDLVASKKVLTPTKWGWTSEPNGDRDASVLRGGD
jgi:hypothetical protein